MKATIPTTFFCQFTLLFIFLFYSFYWARLLLAYTGLDAEQSGWVVFDIAA